MHTFSANQKSASFSCILLKSINMKCMIMFMVWYFNPLTPMSDQDRISPYNINTISIQYQPEVSDENKEKYQFGDN